jgi:uncharacterized membrane protein YagU involved in acid resistance
MTSASEKAAAWRGILVGGAIAGVLDIVYACVANGLRGRPPLRTLQSVASGVLGRDAFEGGWTAGALGLFCHFAIALGIAAVYWLASRRFRLLRDRPVVAGALYGMLVYLAMNFVVLPLSAVPFKLQHTATTFAWGFASHALLIGIPIALAIRHFAQRPFR